MISQYFYFEVRLFMRIFDPLSYILKIMWEPSHVTACEGHFYPIEISYRKWIETIFPNTDIFKRNQSDFSTYDEILNKKCISGSK